MQKPADGKDHIVPVLGKGRADEVHADNVEGRHEPDNDQTSFWDNNAVVAAHVHVANEIV